MTNNEIIQTLKDAIDLISRQQAEIDILKAHLKKVCAERDARICTNNFIKSEAVKEFAERLKKVWWDNSYESPDVDFDDFVDNLVKEMVGDDNA